MSGPPSRQATGQQGEDLGCDYLQRQGLRLVARNHRCRHGEIDLVMRDGAWLVFVEVRLRRHRGYGGALESVDGRKQARLLHAAQHYLLLHPDSARQPCRFDVLAITPRPGRPPEIQWIKNAFEA